MNSKLEMFRAAGRKMCRRPVYGEDALQKGCKTWFDLAYPEKRLLLHHSPNEGLLPTGAIAGAKRKAMGVRAGFPDFILLCASRKYGYHYMAIELKTATGRLSASQKAYMKAVEGAGGLYVVVRTVDDFRQAVDDYLEGETND